MDQIWINIGIVFLCIYIATLLYITVFCLMQFNLLYRYRKYHRRHTKQSVLNEPGNLPRVTVQLPIFNELYVVERLIDCICALDYPKERLQIQVLDDSTDETLDISRNKVLQYKNQGFDISLMHRTDRSGYKAGALKHATRFASGDYIAIFDADFLPNPSFLKRTIPFFEDPNVGVVQTKWEHLNEDYSLITRLQAFQLNVHFSVEQTARCASDLPLQFNGTAGIWRRRAIEDAGGWEADTLTEDLDLSYRAQLKGWKIKYLEHVGSPAELPAEMNALKSQQFRWMKGGAETAKKILPGIWKSGLPLGHKVHATLHLLSSSIFLFVFIAGVFSVPALLTIEALSIDPLYFTVFLISLLSIGAVYYVSNFDNPYVKDRSPGMKILKFIFLFPVFLSLSMGLSLHNSIAVLQGYFGRESAFIRTPKFNISSANDSFTANKYLTRKLPVSTLVEGFLTLYFLAAVIYFLVIGNTSFLLYHVLLMIGFGYIFYFSIKHSAVK